MAENYGVGIVGAGWVAGEYVKAFRDHPLTHVVGMYNKTPDKATRLMKTHGVDGKEFSSVEELLDDKRIDIVVHCAHADSRPDIISRAAASGRHVVIEKPASLTPEGTAQIRETVTKAGVKSIVSCVLRWNPQFQTIRALLDDGKLGNLMYAEADYWHPIIKAYPGYPYYMKKAHSGSSFVIAGVHAADTLRWLAGEIVEVARVQHRPGHEQGLRVPASHGRRAEVCKRRDRQVVERHRGRDTLHLQLPAVRLGDVHRQQPDPLFKVVPGNAGLL